jgi:hypothetical protein
VSLQLSCCARVPVGELANTLAVGSKQLQFSHACMSTSDQRSARTSSSSPASVSAPRAMNGSDLVWDWNHNDYFMGERLVCAANGNGNPEYKALCSFVQYGLATWYLLLSVCTVVISTKSRRVRKRLESIADSRPASKTRNEKAQTKKIAIAAKITNATVLTQLAIGVLVLQSGLGTKYPSSEPRGMVSNFLFAITYIFSGQTSFWSRQASLHSRDLLAGHSPPQGRTHTTGCSIRRVTDIAEQLLVPIALCVTVTLVATGVCSRYQLVTVVFSCSLAGGVALMHALWFTRLATIYNVIRIHNNAGGQHEVVERRQAVVSRMVLNIVLELVVVFVTLVSFPLLILVYDMHASSTRILVAGSIGLSMNCLVFTLLTLVRFKKLARLNLRLQSAVNATHVRNEEGVLSVCTSSVLQIQSTNFTTPSAIGNTPVA